MHNLILRHSEAAFGHYQAVDKSEIRELFGRNLELWMRRRQINQERLAKLSGLSPGHLSEARRGISAIGLDALAAIAKALQVGPWELLVDEEATREEILRRILSSPPSSTEPLGKAAAPPRRKKPESGGGSRAH